MLRNPAFLRLSAKRVGAVNELMSPVVKLGVENQACIVWCFWPIVYGLELFLDVLLRVTGIFCREKAK